ncbi:hypothetical protein EMIT0210MI2_13206 [Priestia megaterium]
MLYFFLLNANVEEEEKMSLLEDIIISVNKPMRLPKRLIKFGFLFRSPNYTIILKGKDNQYINYIKLVF